MTCRQLGGACDLAHRDATAGAVIKEQDRHLAEQSQEATEPTSRHVRR